MPALARVALSLGSNLGDRFAHLERAAKIIKSNTSIFNVRLSNVYETEPVGGPQQDDYLNAVLVADTNLSALEVLELVKAVEADAKRVRDAHWGPRSLDVDILAVDQVVLDGINLTLPHPRLSERAFVLVPWNDVDPDFVVPGLGAVCDLLRRVDRAGVSLRSELSLAEKADDE
jgi:2-amino-4-hydroxy-6-hydroxymethyldihydropteridine diphosphokinase